ncbi:MAG TPA: N-formylglutamate amidohydrolase [Cyclobacteriaceae bacterium]|nr:N-formylglutamate amidohydrolase [Cyclobacteriaceae bacterium]
MSYALLITCEHAGKLVPKKYKSLFSNSENVLNSHEGWDPGAWDVAQYLGKRLNTTPIGCHTTRLLIETNRSLNSAQLFSRYTAHLNDNEKDILINEIYYPYRQLVQLKIEQLPKPVLHLSIHSFTPVYHGKKRKVELGLLYDPERPSEHHFCQNLQNELTSIVDDIKVRHNEPYLGIDDGFTSYLRSIYGDNQYLGIEIEISQKFIGNLTKIKHALTLGITKTLFS